MKKSLIILFWTITITTLFSNTKIDSLKQQLNLSIDTNRIDLLNQISIYYRNLDPMISLKYSKMAVNESIHISDKSYSFISLRNMGSSFYLLGLIDSSIVYYNKALAIDGINNENDIAKLYFNLSNAYIKKGFFNQAKANLTKSIKKFQESFDIIGEADCYNALGNLHEDISDFDKSLYYYYKSLKIYRQTNSKKGISRSYNNIGNAYFASENHDKAHEYYLESLKIKKELNDRHGIANTYTNLGSICLIEGKLEKALKFHEESNKIRENLQDLIGLAGNYSNIGIIYREMNLPQKAINQHEKSLDIYIQLDLFNEIAATYYEIGNDLFQDKKYNESEKFYNLGEELSKKHNYYHILHSILEKKSEVKEISGDFKLSLKYIREAKAISDTLFSLESRKELAKLQTRLDTEKKEQKIQFLEKQKIFQEDAHKKEQLITELKIKKQQALLFFATVISILIVCLFILLLTRYLSKIKINNILVDKNNELKNAYDTINRSEKNLKELNQTKDKFFSIIAHDLRNPFQALINLSDIITRSHDTIPQKTLIKYNHMINSSAKHLSKLLENLLEWARSQTGSIKLNFAKINLKSIVDANIDLLIHSANGKNITIDNRLQNQVNVFADENTISTVIRNLLSNAIKFTGDSGIIKIDSALENKYIKLKISDNGIGIDEETQNKIFKLDSHLSTKGTANEKGTGLGLILCKEFIEKNNGKIQVKSKIGEGSVFTIRLPIISNPPFNNL